MVKKVFYGLILSLLLLAACQPASPPAPTKPQGETPDTQTTSTPEETETTTPQTDPAETSAPETTAEPTDPSAEFAPLAQLEQVAGELTAPVDLDAPDDGTGRLFVTDQVGLIYVIDGEDNQLETPFLDLQNRLVNLNPNYDERGLLGLAFHPNYAENGRFFVYYSAPLQTDAPSGYNHTSVVSEFTVSEKDPNIANPDSERIILQVDQPQANHNAGAIAFGPADGYLYIPLGDGGAGSDRGPGHTEDWYDANAGGNGQDVEDNPLGSVLRIDVDRGDPYTVPEDNPDISENYPEIWAYGFRNPYRMAFDPAGDHDLFLGDVGQELWEEVSIVEAGGNYGWNVKEGTHCFSTANPGDPNAITDCPDTDPSGNLLIDPIIEFRNSKHPEGGLSVSIIGGVVYRGESLPAWDGRYVFGHWSATAGSPQGGLFVAERAEEGLWDFQEIEILNRQEDALNEYLLALGNDQDGEVYVLTSLTVGPSGDTGSVYRILPPESITSD
ncbi:MAG: PQQ-dependent sugar dehydrogenase [Brevefilum sp.]